MKIYITKFQWKNPFHKIVRQCRVIIIIEIWLCYCLWNCIFIFLKLHFWMYKCLQYSEKPLFHMGCTISTIGMDNPNIFSKVLARFWAKHMGKMCLNFFQKVERLDNSKLYILVGRLLSQIYYWRKVAAHLLYMKYSGKVISMWYIVNYRYYWLIKK